MMKLLNSTVAEMEAMGLLADVQDTDTNKLLKFKNTAMPAVLSENGFFTNYQDALLMIDSEWQETIAKAHAKGILAYAIEQGVEW